MDFFENISEGENILGDAFIHSLDYYIENVIPNYPSIIKDTQYGVPLGEFLEPHIYTLFGDPSLRIGGIKQ